MPEIETRRLLFRKFTHDDIDALWTIRADPDVMKYIGSGKPESIAEVQAILKKILAHWDQHGFGPWALIDKGSKQLIGWCGLLYLENTTDVEIGYGFAKSHWGKGVASEAAAATLKYGFEQLGLARIVAVTWPENLASQRVLAKLGMKYVKTGRFSGVEMRYFAISRGEYQQA